MSLWADFSVKIPSLGVILMHCFERRSFLVRGLLVGGSLILSGCSISGSESDNRFEKFTEPSKNLTVKTDLRNVCRRMPGIRVSAAHWVAQRKDGGRGDLPAPEDRYWFHAVIELAPDSTRVLAEASDDEASLLPGIYPGLRQYVPKDDVFFSVPKKKADKILDVGNLMQDEEEGVGSEKFGVDRLAVCSSSNLMLLIGSGIKP